MLFPSPNLSPILLYAICSLGGGSVGRMRSPAAWRSTMRLMTCRNARALASMMSVLTARPRHDPAVVLGLDVRLALGVLADRDAADAVVAQRRRRCR